MERSFRQLRAGLLVLALGAPAARAEAPVCRLPEKRPAELVIRFSRITRPIQGPARTEGLALRATCPADERQPCLALPSAELDALYTTFVERGFDRLGRAGVGTTSPHYGFQSLELAWPGGSCAVADASEHALSSEDRPRFAALVDRVLAASTPARERR